MSRAPRPLADFINWASTHGAIFDTNHAALGIPATLSANFKAAAKAASDAYTAQLNALELAKGATTTQNNAVAAARQLASDCIRNITAFAVQQTNPDAVYTLAQIPPPATPTPQPPPGAPTDFTATLGTDGAVTLKWKAVNAGSVGSTVWTVARRTGSSGTFTFVGASGKRVFTDSTIPAGVTNVQYQITGQRGDAVGTASLPFTVQFGNNGDGLTIAAAFSGDPAPAKLAA